MQTEIEISTERSRLNIDFIHKFISSTYWANGRSIATMKTCIENSLNFGVYLGDHQVGYGRLVTDFGQFAYIMDIFIAPEFRGRGYSKQLMKFITELSELSQVKIWRLATNDAHGLYEQFGFRQLASPEKLMELIR